MLVDHAELEEDPIRPHKTRTQKRRDKFLASANKQPEHVKEPRKLIAFEIFSDIAVIQRADPKLKFWFDKVSEGEKLGRTNCLADATYIIKNGILYQRQDKIEALALPQCFTQCH